MLGCCRRGKKGTKLVEQLDRLGCLLRFALGRPLCLEVDGLLLSKHDLLLGVGDQLLGFGFLGMQLGNL